MLLLFLGIILLCPRRFVAKNISIGLQCRPLKEIVNIIYHLQTLVYKYVQTQQLHTVLRSTCDGWEQVGLLARNAGIQLIKLDFFGLVQ